MRCQKAGAVQLGGTVAYARSRSATCQNPKRQKKAAKAISSQNLLVDCELQTSPRRNCVHIGAPVALDTSLKGSAQKSGGVWPHLLKQ